jgi:hypothetical protein
MKLRDRFFGLPIWAKLIAYAIAAALAIFVAARLIGALQIAFFGDPRVKQEHGNAVVAQEQTQAAKDTGAEATNTVVRTYDRTIQIDHWVKEGQNAIARADRGQQMDPAIDAATANALCGVHDSLCRR